MPESLLDTGLLKKNYLLFFTVICIRASVHIRTCATGHMWRSEDTCGSWLAPFLLVALILINVSFILRRSHKLVTMGLTSSHRLCPSIITNLSMWHGFLAPFEKWKKLVKQDLHFHRTVGSWIGLVASPSARTCVVQIFTVPTTPSCIPSPFFTLLCLAIELSEPFHSCLSSHIQQISYVYMKLLECVSLVLVQTQHSVPSTLRDETIFL